MFLVTEEHKAGRTRKSPEWPRVIAGSEGGESGSAVLRESEASA